MVGLYAAFVVLILCLLALDLLVFHRHAHAVSVREAIGWSILWIALGLAFCGFVYVAYAGQWWGLGTQLDQADETYNSAGAATLKYLTGYLVEKSLSVDNLFVIAMIFGFFGVPAIYQHRVLFWGIVGAMVMRGGMIAVGAKLIAAFHGVLYLFGGFLILTGIKMLWSGGHHADPAHNPMLRLVRRFVPVTARYHGKHFVVRAGSRAVHEGVAPEDPPQDDPTADRLPAGTWMLTPLALALLLVESADLVFAVDSIPAIFAITTDPFLVFTSNVFAILGLRSLYFALAGLLVRFRYLKVSLALVLMLVGVKMLLAGRLHDWLGHHANLYTLGMVLAVLAAGVLASLLSKPLPAATASEPGRH